jgi:hypothetical protein
MRACLAALVLVLSMACVVRAGDRDGPYAQVDPALKRWIDGPQG